MKMIPRCLALMFILALLGRGGAASAQVPIYSASNTTGTPQPGVEHYLQIINLAQGPGIYTVNRITVSANFTSGDAQKLLVYFYSGVNTDPTATNVLARATLLSGQSGDLLPPGPGNFTFSYDPTPFSVTTGGAGGIAVEIFLASADGTTYSSTARGRFIDNAPTVGTAAGYVWNDANLDSTFTGAEQTRFSMTNANVRMALVGSLTQPFTSLKTYARNGTVATLTVDSYTGVNYQLQRATSLTAGNWTNLGSAVAGANGTILTFTDNDSTDPAAFYRVVAALPTTSPRAASKVLARGL